MVAVGRQPLGAMAGPPELAVAEAIRLPVVFLEAVRVAEQAEAVRVVANRCSPVCAVRRTIRPVQHCSAKRAYTQISPWMRCHLT